MRKLLLLVILGLAGCQNFIGPLQYRRPLRVDDPCLPIREQERRARDRYALPDESYEMGPNTGFARPGLDGGQQR